MSRSAAAKRKRQMQQARKAVNLVIPEAREPINLSEASFVRRQAKKKQQGSNGPQSLSMAWDDNSLGVNSTQTREGLLDERERKDTYYKVFIGNQVVSGCCNVISKRITSGGWECVEVEQGKGNPQNKEKIEALLRFENLEEDFQQFLRSIAVDILVFGEAYCELVWSAGVVVGLYVIDAISMTTMFDHHGNVIKYVQRMEKSTQTIDFEPEQIIRWWLPDPRAKKKALSPIEHLKDPVYLDQSMITFVEKFFKQGARFGYSVELGEGTTIEDAQRYAKFFKENYTGVQNSHVPPIVHGGGKIVESGKGSVDIDFNKGQDKQRDRVLMVYGVPPAELNIIESGNLGSGKGDAQSKSFTYNTVMPLKEIILEKFNYRVIKKGLGIEDWMVDTRQADYRDDREISEIEDKGIRNGTLTINEARASRGRLPVKGGDEAVIVASRDILPVIRNAEIADEQRDAAQIDIETKKAQVEKIKNPPPPPVMVAPGQQPPNGKQLPQNGAKGQQPPQQKGNQQQDKQKNEAREALLQYYQAREQIDWRNERIQEESHTGVMVAFFLKPSEAQQLALPGGEPIDEIHMTLCYLGDKSQIWNFDKLEQAVSNYAKSAPALQGNVSGIGRFLAVPDGEPTPIYASVDSSGLPDFRYGLVQALKDAGFIINMEHGYSPHITLSYVSKSASMPIDTVATIPLNFDTLWLAIGDDRYAFPLDRTEEHAQQQSKETRQEALVQSIAESYESRPPLGRAVWQAGVVSREPFQEHDCSESSSSTRLGGDNADTQAHNTPSQEDRDTQAQEAYDTQDSPYEAYREASRTPSAAAQEVTHWQDEDKDIQKQLAELKAKGIKFVTWKGHAGMCDECTPNDGKRVALGQRFPSGAMTVPEHNHCICEAKYE